MNIFTIVTVATAFVTAAFRMVLRIDSRAGCGTETRADNRAFTPTKLGTNRATHGAAHSAADRCIYRQITRRGERCGEREGYYPKVS
jgi:hypothetical protein